MRKLTIYVMVLVLLNLTTSTVGAVGNTGAGATTNSPAAVVEQVNQAGTPPTNREEVRTNIQEQRAASAQKIQQTRQNVRSQVAQRHAARLSYRFAVYNTRLTNIAERIQSRLDILEADGKDTAAAQVQLTEAKAGLSKAKAKSEAAINTFNSINPDDYEAQRDLALQARDIAQESREDWQSVIVSLREVLQTIKAL